MSSIEKVASELREAYTKGPIPPLRQFIDPHDDRLAYAVQRANTAYWISQGRRVVGRKIGLTAKAVQAQSGVGQPDYGVLFDDMAVEDGAVLPASRLIQPKIEAEVAFIMGVDLPGPVISRPDVEAAVKEVRTAIEIVDSRIADWKISFADTVADNGSSAFFVLASGAHSLAGLDLWSCGMVLEINGTVVSMGAGAACLGHPLEAVTWLAQNLADRGEQIRAGDIVLSGALGPMVTIAPGDHVRATVGGLGSVSFVMGSVTP